MLTPVAGRKGAAYTRALAVLVLFAFLAGIQTDPFRWVWPDGALDALLMALAGVLSAFVVGNGVEHHAKPEKPPETPSV